MGTKPTPRSIPVAPGSRTPRRSIHECGLFADCPDLVGTPFSYAREEEVYGEGEDAEFVYRVVEGAVRSHKILSDGRRQITGFPLGGQPVRVRAGRHPLAHGGGALGHPGADLPAAADRAGRHPQRRSRLPALGHGDDQLARRPGISCSCSAAVPPGARRRLSHRGRWPLRRHRGVRPADDPTRYRRLSRPHHRDCLTHLLAARGETGAAALRSRQITLHRGRLRNVSRTDTASHSIFVSGRRVQGCAVRHRRDGALARHRHGRIADGRERSAHGLEHRSGDQWARNSGTGRACQERVRDTAEEPFLQA